MPAALGNLVFTKLLAENLARPESILTFFPRTVTFGVYEQGLICLSGFYSPVQKTICRVVGWAGVSVPRHYGRCWRWTHIPGVEGEGTRQGGEKGMGKMC